MEKGLLDYVVGEEFTGYLLVKDVVPGTAKNGNDYFRVILGDATGTLGGMVWGVGATEKSIFVVGEVIVVKCVISEYQGDKQLTLQRYRSLKEDEEVDLSLILEASPELEDDLYKQFLGYIMSLEDEDIKEVVKKVVVKYKDDVRVYPAARSNHHAYVNGLLYHTVSMLRLGDSICTLRTELNRDLVIAGIILHDIGKVVEYSGYTSPEFTLEGKLKGHISIINEDIANVVKELGYGDKESILMLQHICLSHHGKTEWGSPVRPQIIEAEIVHMIDMMDAALDAYKTASKETKVGEFTSKIFSLDNRAFYKHGL